MRASCARASFRLQANHRLYTEYHERILKAVDICLPVEKVCSIDEMACKLMWAPNGKGRRFPTCRHCRGICFELSHAAKHVGEVDQLEDGHAPAG
jgi:hypothetical protein